jgi:hypothetical protein
MALPKSIWLNCSLDDIIDDDLNTEIDDIFDDIDISNWFDPTDDYLDFIDDFIYLLI